MAFLPWVSAALSGALLVLVSPPIGWDWLHWVTFVPLLCALGADDGPRPRGRGRAIRVSLGVGLYLLMATIFAVVGNVPALGVMAVVVVLGIGLARDRSDRTRNFRLGWVAGITATFGLFFWLLDTITTFSNIPFPLAVGILLIFSFAFSIPYGVAMALLGPVRQRFGDGWVFLFPAVWVASEWIAPSLFPYFQGVGQYRNPYTWQSASVFGATFLSWLVLATNCAVASLILARRAGRALPWRPAAVVALLWSANLGFGVWRHGVVQAQMASAPTVRIGLLQQGVTMLDRIQDRGKKVLESWLALTTKVAAERPDLVVWPEGSIGYNPTEPAVAQILGDQSRAGGFHLLVGGGTGEPDPVNPDHRLHWNSAYLFSDDGKITGRYDKMVPLPFGEYLPPPFDLLDDLITGVGHFQPGSRASVFDVQTSSGAVQFTTPICYEAILEHQMRELTPPDVDLILNITNDGWFGDTSAPHQHAMLAAVHAMELGRPMVRVAYTGISMLITPDGTISHEHPFGTEAAEIITVPLVALDTPYRTWGAAFPWALTFVGLGVVVLALRGSVTPTPPTA